MEFSQLPTEIIEHVLSFVDLKSQVFSCRLVCKLWCNIVETQLARTGGPPWFVGYARKIGALESNLLLHRKDDHCTTVKRVGYFGHTLKVKYPFHGCKSVTDNLVAPNIAAGARIVGCYVTGYKYWTKHQAIDLQRHKVSPKIMDELQPTVEISEWYETCGIAPCYQLTAQLLNANSKVVRSETFRAEPEARPGVRWRRAVVRMRGYGPGVRYICFEHSGRDKKFWKRHQGDGTAMIYPKVCLRLLPE